LQRFARLFAELDATTSTRTKVEAMERYFRAAEPRDAAWALYFLAGNKPRQIVPVRLLARLAVEQAGIPDWLFDESYQAVGDLAETIAHVLPENDGMHAGTLAEWVEDRLLPLRGLDEAEVRSRLPGYWRELDANGRLVMNKLITGALRVGVSRLLVQRAVAQAAGLDARVVAERMAGAFEPTPERYVDLIASEATTTRVGQPYPFFLAHPLQDSPAALGDPHDWIAEWKWDGIRGQLIRREGRTFVWSRGEELVTERFPEIAHAGGRLADGTVLDGEILAWSGEAVLPFARLQQRIGRKALTAKV